MQILRIIFGVLALCIMSPSVMAVDGQIPRTIIGIYQQKVESNKKEALIHAFAEMPLNHLGFVLETHDIELLPDLSGRDDVVGVMIWALPGVRISEPLTLIEWCNNAIDNGKKLLLMGHHGLLVNSNEERTDTGAVNSLFNRLGVSVEEEWIDSDYQVTVLNKDDLYVEFERKYKIFFPPFLKIKIFGEDVDSHLVLQSQKEENSHVIFSGDKGGFVSSGYEVMLNNQFGKEVRQWYINPFTFFAKVFDVKKNVPVPDVTTLAGRRIYYSHIDGDGWNSFSQLEEYTKKPMLVSEVVMEKAIKPYPDLPVTVAPVGADIDLDWMGTEESIRIAREILALPQVEIATHTYSHPLQWGFFEDGDKEKERPFLSRYNHPTWGDYTEKNVDYDVHAAKGHVYLDAAYKVPRAFATYPFDIEKEVQGSVDYIESLAPEGKKIKLLQWSGDCSPFEEAVQKTVDANLFNINGGDNRFDAEYDSYGWMAPVGIKVGDHYQIYASNSNENTYTDDWSERFFGFEFLKVTVDRTESPIRLRPFNVYYHMYSAEKESSLRALIKNLEYARASNLTPIATGDYAEMALGFYSSYLYEESPNAYRVKDRGTLQTFRIDSDRFAVDSQKSQGVVGENYFQGSIYIYLDKEVSEPLIVIKNRDDSVQIPFLQESRWQVYGLNYEDSNFSFFTQGYGGLDMKWKVPHDGEYRVIHNDELIETVVAKDNTLTLNKKEMFGVDPIALRIERKS